MIHLKTKSSYSFRNAFAPIDKLVAKADIAMAITDNGGTWGHVAFYKECNKKAIKPILGVALNVIHNAKLKEKQNGVEMVFIARNQKGLRQVYDITTLANEASNFYYSPRISYSDLVDLSDDVFVITGVNPHEVPNRDNFLPEYSIQSEWYANKLNGVRGIATCDNYYIEKEDKACYEAICKFPHDKTTPMWLASDEEYRAHINNANAINLEIANECNVHLPTAKFVEFNSEKSLHQTCIESAEARNIELTPEYMTRMEYELDLIKKKNFEDYFFVVADMVNYAKQHMIVGVGRGSACGSLVSYCLGITEVDPIEHGLIFERFIDINRDDYPDIDIDFPVEHREKVFEYLGEKYGKNSIGRIGTVGTWSDQVTIGEISKHLGIDYGEVREYKESLDGATIRDTIDSTASGKKLLSRHPEMGICSKIEGNPKQSGVHPAGLVISRGDIREHCSVDRNGVIALDKNDAETLGLIKLDILGLRTLTLINDCLNQIGKDVTFLNNHPLDDSKVFNLFNEGKLCGMFQFEGSAVRNATKEMGVDCFDDIVHLTTIVRPGSSSSQETFFKRRKGLVLPTPLHPSLEAITAETYGVFLYQEQLMNVCREAGFTWAEVSDVRRLMSKSKGFDKYREKFVNGFEDINFEDATKIWEKLVTFGQYAFNKSHAVSYSLLTYWCAILKTYHPLEFFTSCLRYPKDEAETVRLLRELVREGFEYKPVDMYHLNLNWEVIDGCVVGGLTNIKGMGEKKALGLIKRLKEGTKLTPTQQKVLDNPITPFDDVFECSTRFGSYYDNPKVWELKNVKEDGSYKFIGKVMEKKMRDKNGKPYCSFIVEDDTSNIPVTVRDINYKNYGEIEEGEFYLFNGKYVKDYNRVFSDSRTTL